MAQTIILRKTDGRLTFDREPAYVFSLLSNGTYTITVKRTTGRRTVSQNNLMWMWFACIERETGTPKQDVHDYYCKRFLRRSVNIGNKTETVVGDTSRLTTEQMTEFLSRIQADASTEMGITLPQPEDMYFEAFYQQFND